jgi:hypothetical protein
MHACVHTQTAVLLGSHSGAPINACMCSACKRAQPIFVTTHTPMQFDKHNCLASMHTHSSSMRHVRASVSASMQTTCQQTSPCGTQPQSGQSRSTPIQLPYCAESSNATGTENHTLPPHTEKAELSPQRCTGRPGRLLMTRSPRLTTSMPVLSCTHPTMLVATPAPHRHRHTQLQRGNNVCGELLRGGL